MLIYTNINLFDFYEFLIITFNIKSINSKLFKITINIYKFTLLE